MKAKKSVRFDCPDCGTVEETPSAPTQCARIEAIDELVPVSELDLVDAQQCGACGTWHEEIPSVLGWVCGECEEWYEDREDAVECCRW